MKDKLDEEERKKQEEEDAKRKKEEEEKKKAEPEQVNKCWAIITKLSQTNSIKIKSQMTNSQKKDNGKTESLILR